MAEGKTLTQRKENHQIANNSQVLQKIKQPEKKLKIPLFDIKLCIGEMTNSFKKPNLLKANQFCGDVILIHCCNGNYRDLEGDLENVCSVSDYAGITDLNNILKLD